MEGIFTELSNPVWWFSVVLAGIAINILSSYLRGALDNFFSKSSSWWRNRSEARRKAWEGRVSSIVSNSKEREILIAEESRTRLKSIYYLVLASILFDVYFPIGLLVFAPIFLLWKRVDDIETVLKEVNNRLSSQILKEDADLVCRNAKLEEELKKATDIISRCIVRKDTDA